MFYVAMKTRSDTQLKAKGHDIGVPLHYGSTIPEMVFSNHLVEIRYLKR